MLDKAPLQWASRGEPAKLEEFIPRSWQKPGFQRRTKLTHLAFLDICREHGVTSEAAAWTLAEDFESKSDRGLMAYLLENDVGAAMAKVQAAMSAAEASRRAKLSRMDILEVGEYFSGARTFAIFTILITCSIL